MQVAESRGEELWDLSDDEFASISPHLTPGVREVLTTLGSIDSRSSKGGTGRASVAAQLDNAKVTSASLREFAKGL